MALQAPRGTLDVLPKDSYKWHFIENTIREVARKYQYKEVRTPVFEHTELFVRGVGDTTDIVEKEMYTFIDKGKRSITLRPENTATALRAFIEHKLYADPQPSKMYYIASAFRYEKPQAGRLRAFHQFGIEALGSIDPALDAEVIDVAMSVFETFGLKNLTLTINSIGCKTCRPNHREALLHYFENHREDLCPTCIERLHRNPLRIVDCKNEKCSEIAKDAPTTLDYLCDECKDHFDGVKEHLSLLDMPYTINPKIVRGLDYYTKTVFEILSSDLGAQSTVCGGGR